LTLLVHQDSAGTASVYCWQFLMFVCWTVYSVVLDSLQI